MSKNIIPYNWDICKISRDVFEVKFPNLYVRRDINDSILLNYWETQIFIWNFQNWVFICWTLFDMEILEILNKKLENIDLITIEIKVRDDIASIIGKLIK